jgi:hypothetical protein
MCEGIAFGLGGVLIAGAWFNELRMGFYKGLVLWGLEDRRVLKRQRQQCKAHGGHGEATISCWDDSKEQLFTTDNQIHSAWIVARASVIACSKLDDK